MHEVAAYIDQCVPSLPEITIRNHTDGITQLRLNARRTRNHQRDDLPLDRNDLILRQLVISFLVCPVALDEVLEEQGAGEASLIGIGL